MNQQTMKDNRLRLWLDDERPAPEGWVRIKRALSAVNWIKTNYSNVSEISFDHDLGAPEMGTGYDVAVWLEEFVVTQSEVTTVPILRIHSANPVGRQRMQSAIDNINRTIQSRNGGF